MNRINVIKHKKLNLILKNKLHKYAKMINQGMHDFNINNLSFNNYKTQHIITYTNINNKYNINDKNNIDII